MSVAFVADHLWQSLLCLLVAAAFDLALRRASARVRLWLWRLAFAKFLAPFALLRLLGAWMGFPVRHASEAAPVFLVEWIEALRPWLAPVRIHALEGFPALAFLALLLVICGGWMLWMRRRLRVEHQLAHWEELHALDDPPPAIRPVGFVRAACLTLLAMAAVMAPAVTGAVEDRQRRHALIVANAEALRDAGYRIQVANTGQGARWRLRAHPAGVTLRNVTVQELIAIAYGVSSAAVMGNQAVSSDSPDPYDYWLLWPRYDLEIEGPVREPERFDAYSLHLLITRLMAERFGIEIHVNGRCQDPCGRWALPSRAGS